MLYLFALVAGVLNALQSGGNATLAKALGQPVVAGLIITTGGGLGILLSAVFLGLSPREAAQRAADVPWWAWCTGLFGAVYVLSTLLVAKQVGAAVFTGLTVTAALVTSLVLDHFGWLGFEQHSASLGRMAGALLMIGGLLLLTRAS